MVIRQLLSFAFLLLAAYLLYTALMAPMIAATAPLILAIICALVGWRIHPDTRRPRTPS